MIGDASLDHDFLYLHPFYKALFRLCKTENWDGILKLDESTIQVDPTLVVEGDVNRWWDDPQLTGRMYPLAGIDRFQRKVFDPF